MKKKIEKLPAEKVKALMPEQARLVFEGVPLLTGESRQDYDYFLDGFTASVHPMDFVERMLIEQCAVFTLEANRYNQGRARIVDNTRKESLLRILESILPAERRHEAIDLAEQYFDKSKDQREFQRLISNYDLRGDFIGAEAIVLRLNEVIALDQLTEKTLTRVTRILEEIELRRMSQSRSPALIDHADAARDTPAIHPALLEAGPLQQVHCNAPDADSYKDVPTAANKLTKDVSNGNVSAD